VLGVGAFEDVAVFTANCVGSTSFAQLVTIRVTLDVFKDDRRNPPFPGASCFGVVVHVARKVSTDTIEHSSNPFGSFYWTFFGVAHPAHVPAHRHVTFPESSCLQSVESSLPRLL